MRQILRIVMNDLRRRLRSPVAVILLMLIPVVITLIIGLVFGRSGEVSIPRITVLLDDRDGGMFGGFFSQAMRQDRFAEMIELVSVSGEEGERMMGEGKASALVVIPEHFTEHILDQVPDTVRVLKNPAETFLPVIVEEFVVTTALMLDRGNRIFSGQIGQIRSMFEGDRWPTGDEVQRFLDGAHDRFILIEAYIGDSLVSYEVADAVSEEPEDDGGFNLFALLLPGSLLIGLLFISEISMRDIFRERHAGTLGRLFTAPVGTGQYIAGKVLSTFCITALACIILLIVGRFGFGIDLGRPAPLVIHFVGTILMCTGLVTVFYGFIRTERAADAIMSIVIVVLALMGGSMVPYEQMGAGMRRVARFSPVFWANDGFKRIFLDDWGVPELGLHIAVLYGLAAITVVVGAVMLRRQIGKGA
jgi:ABC-2 type transport system permease protein